MMLDVCVVDKVLHRTFSSLRPPPRLFLGGGIVLPMITKELRSINLVENSPGMCGSCCCSSGVDLSVIPAFSLDVP
jgi:hypothetical protein